MPLNCQVTVNNSILYVGGTIGDSPSGYGITKAGAGTLWLSGALTFGGSLTMNAGILRIAGTSNTFGGANQFFTLNAGTLYLDSATALGNANTVFVINGGIIDNTSGSAITISNNNPQVWHAAFTFTGSNARQRSLIISLL
jgi:autotransporter-associated beta strand protein